MNLHLCNTGDYCKPKVLHNFRYGFVEFEDTRDADDAVYELNGKDLCGERVIVEHARGPRRDRDGYGGGYGGGSGRSKYSLLRHLDKPFVFFFPSLRHEEKVEVNNKCFLFIYSELSIAPASSD